MRKRLHTSSPPLLFFFWRNSLCRPLGCHHFGPVSLSSLSSPTPPSRPSISPFPTSVSETIKKVFFVWERNIKYAFNIVPQSQRWWEKILTFKQFQKKLFDGFQNAGWAPASFSSSPPTFFYVWERKSLEEKARKRKNFSSVRRFSKERRTNSFLFPSFIWERAITGGRTGYVCVCDHMGEDEDGKGGEKKTLNFNSHPSLPPW